MTDFKQEWGNITMSLTRRHYNAIFHVIASLASLRPCVLRYVCHIIQPGTRCQCFRGCLQLDTCSPPFVGITSILVLNTRSSWSLFQRCANTQNYLYDYDMTKRTLIELAYPYPHTPITKQLSGIPDTAGLGFWCVFKFLHMQASFFLNFDFLGVIFPENPTNFAGSKEIPAKMKRSNNS